MPDPADQRVTIRARQSDLNNIATLAGVLRGTGKFPFATMTDAVRYALTRAVAELPTSPAVGNVR